MHYIAIDLDHWIPAFMRWLETQRAIWDEYTVR